MERLNIHAFMGFNGNGYLIRVKIFMLNFFQTGKLNGRCKLNKIMPFFILWITLLFASNFIFAMQGIKRNSARPSRTIFYYNSFRYNTMRG